MVFHFPDLATLHVALATGLIPAEVAGSPVQVAFEGENVFVESRPFELSNHLLGIGVTKRTSLPASAESYPSWLAIFPLTRHGSPDDSAPSEVLFELPPPLLGDFAIEMLRLGNDRQTCREMTRDGQARVLLHVFNPPYYTLLRALDRFDDGVVAYRQAAPHVWVQMGYEHPFAAGLATPADATFLLRAPRSWLRMERTPFRDIYEVMNLDGPAASAALNSAKPSRPIGVPLRLAPGNATETPELWVLREDSVAHLDRFVRNADERTLARLLFAVAADTIVVRARRSTERFAPPELPAASGFVRHRQLPLLYLPAGSRLHPVLKREAVRDLLCPNDELVVWLTAGENGGFTPESLPDEAFRPLHDWIEFVIDRERSAVGTWISEVECDFEAFVGAGEVVETSPEKPAVKKEKPAAVETPAPPPKPVELPQPVEEIPFAEPVPFEPAEPLRRSDLSREREELENRFLSAEGPNESPERLALWPRLARVNAALGDLPEAAICWVHALWEREDLPRDWLAEWRQAEAGTPAVNLDADLASDLLKTEPTNGDLRRLSVRVLEASTSSSPALQKHLPEVRRYLEKHEANLGVRAAWLTWRALTRVTSDPLGLARVRDRLLERLMREGLKRQHDVPNFVHFAGQRDSDRLRRAQDVLWEFRGEVHEWLERQQTSAEALHKSLESTYWYADLMFAYGFARLGEERHREELTRAALANLRNSTDPIPRFFAEAFAFRIEQGRDEGARGPLPATATALIERLDNNDLVSVSRLRTGSLILEPHERSDPLFSAKTPANVEVRDGLIRLQRMTDPKALQGEARRILARMPKDRASWDHFAALTEIIPLSTRVGLEFATEVLSLVPLVLSLPGTEDPNLAERQAMLVDSSVPIASNYGLVDLLRKIFGGFMANLRLLPEAAVSKPIGRAVGQWLGAIGRCGLGEQMHGLMEELTELLLRGRKVADLRRDYQRDAARSYWPDVLKALLQISEYWIHFGSVERTAAYLDEARHFLFADTPKRVAANLYPPVARAYIRAVGQLPDIDRVVTHYREVLHRLPPIPNTLTTARYYSLLHLGIVESLVLSLVSDDFVLGETTRRWLDDDEYLVRRRIHADMRAALGE